MTSTATDISADPAGPGLDHDEGNDEEGADDRDGAPERPGPENRSALTMALRFIRSVPEATKRTRR